MPLRQSTHSTPGPINDLHRAARTGFIEAAIGILALGPIDIDQGDPQGWTPLIWASFCNHPSVVRLLLDKGASLEIALEDGFNALHLAIQEGHLAVTNVLVEAGADLQATAGGHSPLHLAVGGTSRPQVAAALIRAGANVNHRAPDGATPLYAAAWDGNIECVRVLLRANANLFLSRVQPSGRWFTPLDAAAQNGHASVARELIPHLGSEAIGGGASAGVTALRVAAQHRHLNVMAVLTDAGVVDTGSALCGAAGFGNDASVSYLLQREQERTEPREGLYANSLDNLGRSPLVICIATCRQCSPRIARLLIDAGADSTSTVEVKDSAGSVRFHGPPLDLVGNHLDAKIIQGEDASEEQLHALEAIRRLLLQIKAVHEVTWVWPNNVPHVADAAEGSRRTNMASTIPSPLRETLPTLRLRATRQRVLWAALSR